MKSRFAPLNWSLEILQEDSGIRGENSPLSKKAKQTSYPFRALRYWHAGQLVAIERKRLPTRPFDLIDLGCKRGTLKMLTPPLQATRWIGLDLKLEEHKVRELGYGEVLLADFDQPLPLADDSADMAVCLHVLEHLPRLDFTLQEFRRVLRPGGVLVVGTPVLPPIAAEIRDGMFKRGFEKGTRRPGNHVHAFSPSRWRKLLTQNDYSVERVFGSHLYRQSGSPLENKSWWVRLNQAWGLAFPSLGRDIIIQARVEK